MNALHATTRPSRRPPHMARALTLPELLVSLGILLILASVTLVASNVLSSARKRATAEQQMAVISTAIDLYAESWPTWQVIDTSGTNVTIADRGWPDFSPGRLFPAPPFNEITDYNDDVNFTLGPDVNVNQRISGVVYPTLDDMIVGVGDVLNANTCLTYALTASSGEGPYIEDNDSALLTDIRKVDNRITNPGYPTLGTGAKNAQVFVDPWGTPYRYFWVYRDPDTAEATRSHTGYLPVDFAAYLPDASADGGVSNPAFCPPGDPHKKAAGFVLDSAGPDRKYGNIWKAGPLDWERAFSEDNLTIRP